MALFSQRNSYTLEKILQVESLDAETRNQIWNLFYKYEEKDFDKFQRFLKNVWGEYLKFPLDIIPRETYVQYISSKFLKEKIINGEWFIVFDIIELALENFNHFSDKINTLLKKENCAYRIINNQIVEISNQEEIIEICEAMDYNREIKLHLERALQYYSDRENPDYRNSIKESISAVENICRNLTKESTLDRAIKKFEAKGLYINSQLKEGLEKIYFYTNSKEGIRHALMEESRITKADAKFMLVICSAFVNYLKENIA